MYKIILDPNLFECDKNASREYQLNHFRYLDDCISFINDYCIVTIDIYQGAPYWYSSNPFIAPPITESHYLKVSFLKIKKNLQQIIYKNFNEVEIDQSKGEISVSGINFIELSKCKDAFLKYLETQFSKLDSCILILGMEGETSNTTVQLKDKCNILQAINNLPSDCSNSVVNILCCLNNDVELFPNISACSSLNDSFQDEINRKHLSHSEKIGIMRKYGREFASRNFYDKDEKLSRSNPGFIVFMNKTNGYAISIDQEHGGIEVFKKKKRSQKYRNGKKSSFIHKGEYSFSGNKIKSSEPQNHIIYD